MVTVVKINQEHTNFTHYIGRKWFGSRGHPKPLEESPLHNPYRVGPDGTREQVLLKFIEYWYAPEQRHLRYWAKRNINVNDILGCWCKPESCHGDIIAGYLNWVFQEPEWCPCTVVESLDYISRNDRRFTASNSGITGSCEPAWPQHPKLGDVVFDNGIRWTFVGSHTKVTDFWIK